MLVSCQSITDTAAINKRCTELRKDNEILCVALWTQDFCSAVTTLFLIDPSLQAHLMDPTVCSAASTWPYPQCIAVIFL